MKVLVTGFNAFGNHAVNPTEKMIHCLEDEYLSQADVNFMLLETSFNSSFKELKIKIEQWRPDIILMFGLSSRSKCFHFEKIAINFVDAPIQDNDGDRPQFEKIAEDANDGYFSTIPIEEMMTLVDGKLSLSAGSYVCNYLFFKVMHLLHASRANMRAGFIHVPPTSEMDNESCLNQADINQKCRELINFAIKL